MRRLRLLVLLLLAGPLDQTEQLAPLVIMEADDALAARVDLAGRDLDRAGHRVLLS